MIGTRRNDQRPHYQYSFDQLCAYCERPIPYGKTANELWRYGWVQESDGTFVCASCAHPTQERLRQAVEKIGPQG